MPPTNLSPESPKWLRKLIRHLNQVSEPSDIVKYEIRFLRLCRWETPERTIAFREAYHDLVSQLVDLGADLYEQKHNSEGVSATTHGVG